MSIITVLAIAVGLSLDAMVVAVINGMCYQSSKKLLAMPLVFGFFQSAMPFLAICVGNSIKEYIGDNVHLATCAIFVLLGLKMIYEGFYGKEDEACDVKGLSYKTLLLQGILTSLDAMAVGFLFIITKTPTWYIFLIGLTTFVLVGLVMILGQKAGAYLGARANLIGGLLFIGLGIYHLFS